MTVKEVKRKELPAVDDDLAIDTGFDTLEELREDIRRRLLEAEEQPHRGRLPRGRARRGRGAARRCRCPPALIEARAREMWERVLRALAHRGITRETYLQLSGRTEAEFLAESAPDAERALRREAVLTAVVAAEGIDPGEEELLEALRPGAEREELSAAGAPGAVARRGAPGGDPRGPRRAARDRADRRRGAADPARGRRGRASSCGRPRSERTEREREEQVHEAQEHTREDAQGVGGLWTPDR